MARERLNGYLHPKVMAKLRDIAEVNNFKRSPYMPSIELCVKQLYPDALRDVVPGKYGTAIEQAIESVNEHCDTIQKPSQKPDCDTINAGAHNAVKNELSPSKAMVVPFWGGSPEINGKVKQVDDVKEVAEK